MPLHLVLREYVTPRVLREALERTTIASLTLRDDLIIPEFATWSTFVPALAGLAPTLTALRGLPIMELHHVAPTGLAGFTRLRALTLRHMRDWHQPLQSALLPASLEELTLASSNALDYCDNFRLPPVFGTFGKLCLLRRITFTGYAAWRLGSWDRYEGLLSRVQLPPSCQVFTDIVIVTYRPAARSHVVSRVTAARSNCQRLPCRAVTLCA